MKAQCSICRKEKGMSEEFPMWCERCTEKYGDLTEVERGRTTKVRRKKGDKE